MSYWRKSESVNCSLVSDSLRPHGLQSTRLLSLWGSPGMNTGGGLPFHLPGDLPDSGVKPLSLVSPALASWFFTTSASWEAQPCNYFIDAKKEFNHFLVNMINKIRWHKCPLYNISYLQKKIYGKHDIKRKIISSPKVRNMTQFGKSLKLKCYKLVRI